MKPPETLLLRRIALAVSVLDDIDLVPTDDGVLLTDGTPIDVSWRELRDALAGADPEDDLARIRLRNWLRGRRIAAERHLEELRDLARPVGLPVDHALHPGLAWVRSRVLGDVLDLGLGFAGVGSDPDEVVLIPQTALAAAGVNPYPWWPVARDYLERMGTLAARRVVQSTVPGTFAATGTTLRPMGDCDVVTLLGSRNLRTALCAQDGTGMRAAAVPMRRRGWLDLSRIDPAYAAAAAAATDESERGFTRPVLLTVDEVTLATPGGRPAEIVLRDAAVETPLTRPVRYR